MVAGLPPLTAGDVLDGRYRLDSRLGAGGTSAVWRAHDLELDRTVAVKALLGDGVDPALAGRFEREATILGRLDHPNVVPVVASGSHGGRPYLVMELIEGRTLAAVLDGGPLPVDESLTVVAGVAAGLAAAHRAGVVHRDVKPANIVCGDDGSPRLLDFGIARSSDLTSVTQPAAVLGTASYLAPEQARGEVPTPASDVYALGCVLHACLTGRPPFEGESPLVVAYRHVHDQPAAPSTAVPGIPPAVDALVLRSLAKDPSRRPADAGAFEVELRRAQRGEAAPADATVAVPAVEAGTMLLPAVGAPAASAELIDPSPLAPPPPPLPWYRRGGPLAAMAAALFVVSLLVTQLVTGGADPASADDPPDTTTSTTADTTPTTAAPVVAQVESPPPGKADGGEKPDKGKGRGKGKGKG